MQLTEFRKYCINMFEQCRSRVSAFYPVGRTIESIDLDRKAGISGRKMPYHKCGFLVDEGIGLQEIVKIPAEKAKVVICPVSGMEPPCRGLSV